MRWIWIDRFEEFHSGESAVAIKMVSNAEDHLHEQYPNYPVMPNSLILEGLAQTGGILLGEANGFAEKVVLAKITSARFLDHAIPGDELRYEAKLVDNRAEGGLASCRVLKNGTLMAEAEIFFVPGHTSGHIAYAFREQKALFCGDTLFALGCGRMFEGTPQQFWTSLSRLRALPDDMRVYCAHEYTQSNARFAVTVERDNRKLIERSAAIDAARAKGEATVPSLLGEEKATNPFLRADVPAVQAAVGMAGGDPVAVFAEVRQRKDTFR